MKFLRVLYAHVGTVLKALAIIIFVLGSLVSIVAGIFIIVESKQEEMYGLYLMIFGPIAAWVSSLPLFGFGELIERSINTNEVINNLDEQLYNIAKSIRAIERVACEEDRD